MSYTSVLSEAWKLFKSGKKFLFFELIFSGGFLVVIYALTFIQQILAYSATSSRQVDGDIAAGIGITIFPIMICFSLIGGFLVSVLETGIYKGLVEKHVYDKLLGFKETLKSGFKPFFKVLAADLLALIPLFVVMSVLFVAGILLGAGSYAASSSSSSSSSLAGIYIIVVCCSLLIFLPIFIWYTMFLVTIKNAIIIDNMGVIDSLSYSFNFVKKHLGKFIALFFVGILVSIVVSIPAYCLSFLGGFFQGSASLPSKVGGLNLIGDLVYLFTQMIYSIFILALGIYFYCYWIVSYVKLKKLGEPEVKPTEPVMAQA